MNRGRMLENEDGTHVPYSEPVRPKVREWSEEDWEAAANADTNYQESIDEGSIGIETLDLTVVEERRGDGNWQLLLPGMSPHTSEW